MQNCTSANTSSCIIPNTMVQAHFEQLDCGGKGNKSSMSCYSEQNKTKPFMNYKDFVGTTCSSLFSAISVEWIGVDSSAVSLTVQVVKLGWWVRGGCPAGCSENANCSEVVSPFDGKSGYSCQCLDGFLGDGYSAGTGCRKETNNCSASKLMAGACGGTARIAVLIGAIVAGALTMISIGLISCFLRRRSKEKGRKRKRRQLCESTGISIPVYPYEVIEKATLCFSENRRLGTGAYGTVYLGKLHNEEWVAIKRIKHSDDESTQQVLNEIKLISSISHPNLVRLFGCSIERGEQFLVYEFMPNGTLSQHLQKEKGHGLPWHVRLTIAAETAQAISYLHNAIHPPIYHRDIKSSNILLDHNYKAKVADFGLSRFGLIGLSHVSTAPQGTPGYLDPQYHQNFHLSDKSDVYSFGVVLIEIITGLRAVDFNRPPHQVNLANLAVDKIGKACLNEIIDPFLQLQHNTTSWDLSSLHKVGELAFRCLSFDSELRPCMKEVAVELEQIRLSQWADSGEDMNNINAPSDALSYLSSPYGREKPLALRIDDPGRGEGLSIEEESSRNYSPVSVQEVWPSEPSSPSCSSLLANVAR